MFAWITEEIANSPQERFEWLGLYTEFGSRKCIIPICCFESIDAAATPNFAVSRNNLRSRYALE